MNEKTFSTNDNAEADPVTAARAQLEIAYNQFDHLYRTLADMAFAVETYPAEDDDHKGRAAFAAAFGTIRVLEEEVSATLMRLGRVAK